ncbi:MAG: hypothetical protein CM1200mP9_08600 [Gammaproteobacteria bacterium]|nr:MAG: hypothetical protein CM1200mP9_08600 [Gammaproteobacteria bacterium]
MKLYVFQVAPNPTKVRLYVAEKNALGDELPVEEVSVNIPEGEARTPEFLAKNPHGQLPVLELDDGRCFAESLAIIEYLEDRFPEPPLLGESPEARLGARQMERYIDVGVMMPSVRRSTRLGRPSDYLLTLLLLMLRINVRQNAGLY